MASNHYAMQGRRRTMEDKATLLQHPAFNLELHLTDNIPRSFFAGNVFVPNMRRRFRQICCYR